MDKVVKGATKPKHAPPKAKYIDQIISCTFDNDAGFHEVCRALAARLRDANSTVVFKSLIVVHTLVRAGNQRKVLGFLSGTKMLGLDTVVSGFDTAQNLSKYASYLDRRIRTFGAIKYDIIRDKSERKGERDGVNGCNRLRHLGVDKGLLRETTLLQKEMDSLAECKFYLEDMDDDVTMTALRMLVKDLLMIFQAVNEGVINVLEHYFEMSKTDAATALKIYKRFCVQTQNVVAYLAVAKKMQNIINVQIPNLKHAPVSLAGSLEEYLNDPNFEQNRQEYKENSRVVDGRPPSKSMAPTSTSSATESKPTTSGPSAKPADTAPQSKTFTDFFSSIEAEQPNMFNPQTGSPTAAYFQQQAAHNPFLNRPMSMMNFGQVQPQMTGFAGMQPQQTAFGSAPPQQTGFLQPQMTGFAPGGMLQPQTTGYNPFRQSMIMPQSTGFGNQMQPQMTSMSAQPNSNPFLSASAPAPLQVQHTGAFRPQSMLFSAPGTSQPQQPTTSSLPFSGSNNPSNTSNSLQVPGQAASPKPLAPQPTGSKNPFAPSPEEQERRAKQAAEEAKPQQPSMNQMALEAFMRNQQQQQAQSQPIQSQQPPIPAGNSSSPAPLSSQATGGGGLFANVASSFATSSAPPSNSVGNALSFSSPLPSSSPAPAPLSAQPTGFGGSQVKPFQPSSNFGQAMSTGQAEPPLTSQPTGIPPSSSPAPLAPQPTGFGGSQVKPFQPSSSFGASLAQTLPTISAQATGSGMPSSSGLSSQMTGTSASSGSGFNPFRASMMPSSTSTSNGTASSSLFSQPTGFSSLSSQPTGLPATSAPQQNESWESKFSSTFGAFGSGFNQQSQHNQQESLI